MKQYVAYYRVSTQRQNLGIDAQQTAVNNYINNSQSVLLNYFVEKESGRNNTRPELLKALDTCKTSGATLIIAKLDRLSRDVEFLFKLRNSGVDFLALDVPDLNTLTLAVIGGMAQYEREKISERIKVALAETKAKGTVLGNPNNLINNMDKAVANSRKTRLDKARNNPNNTNAFALIEVLKGQGMRWTAIANTLNKKGFKTSTGKTFQIQTVKNIYNLFSPNQF